MNNTCSTLTPFSTKSFEGYYYPNRGLDVNYSDIFSQLIKDAARTNRFQSDIFYSLASIKKAIDEYDPENPPEMIWVAFRKDGIDGTQYFNVTKDNPKVYGSIYSRYFALYSISFRKEDTEYGDRYFVDFNEYPV